MNYQPIIGLEVHIELATNSKMFCACPADHFGRSPNSQTCPVCLGLPGALPVPNKKAVDWTILLGLALGCRINENSKFDRKNYFYPDLPKGYQISQFDEPLAVSGEVKLEPQNSEPKTIRIRRVHLEEDTGKLQHAELNGEEVSLVDFNRSGVPLAEIVTEPDFRTIEEVDNFLKKLQKIIRYLGISGADMEKGSMRLEPSISLQIINEGPGQDHMIQFPLPNSELPKYRVELKNINSFRFARKALEFEFNRQKELLDKGESPIQQTRGWNEGKNATVPQRTKEEANDYRYFPEPDIPPMKFQTTFISKLRATLPELPDAKSLRFQKEYKISKYNSDILTDDRQIADYFEESVKVANSQNESGQEANIANWIINKKVDISEVVPGELVQQIVLGKQAAQSDEVELNKIIDRVIAENPKAVEDYNNGKENSLQFIIGQVARILKIKPSAEIITLVKNKL